MVLLRVLRQHAPHIINGVVLELGGGNSFFAARILREFSPREYHVVDTNETGLSLMEKLSSKAPLISHRGDVRSMALSIQADAVFSIGLIEHFSDAGRRDAILAHARSTRPRRCGHPKLSGQCLVVGVAGNVR